MRPVQGVGRPTPGDQRTVPAARLRLPAFLHLPAQPDQAHSGKAKEGATDVTIKAIETRYAGCRFRSRTESRWAVFLDHLGIAWEYEPQGFQLASGTRYLPDFKLPDLKLFLEIKGVEPGAADLDKVREFAVAAHAHGYVTLLLVGDIPRPRPDTVGLPARSFLVRGKKVADVTTDWVPATHASQLRAALTAARSARFEFGESG